MIVLEGKFAPPPGFDAVAHLETRIAEFEHASGVIRGLDVADSVKQWIDHRIGELRKERSDRMKVPNGH